MSRSIKKAIDEYQKKFMDKFNTNDFNQIMELVKEKGGRPDFYSIAISLQAGYMIGYRTAKRTSKQSSKPTSAAQ